MRQRYYNPEIKRFVNQDILTGSIGNSQSLNRYSYAQGNPVSYTDPFGLSPLNGLFSGTMLTHTVCELLGWIPGPVGSIANAVDGLVYLLVDKDYKNALYSLGSSVSFGAGKLVAWAGKGSKTALRIQRVCNFAGSAINFAQSAEGTVNMGGMMIDKYIIQGQPFDDSTAMEFLFLGANIFGATKSGTAIATDVRDFGKFAKGSWAKNGKKTLPQGISQEQFNSASKLLRERVGDISGDIVVQGSRAKGTAKPTSDIDIALRVSGDKFDSLINQYFKTPNAGSAKERTMQHAIKTGKIQSGEAKLKGLRLELQDIFGMDVDISVIKIDGPFDNPPFIPFE